MRRLSYILLFLLLTTTTKAQMQTQELYLLNYDYQRTWRFGMTLGLHFFDFNVTNSMQEVYIPSIVTPTVLQAEVITPGLGFNIDVIVDYKIKRNWHLRSGVGICFGERDLNFYNPSGQMVHKMPFDSYYIEVPLHIRYEANRHSNIRPYILAGLNCRYNLGSKVNEAKGVYFGLTPVEPFYEAGFGFDFYNYYFKLAVELKYSGGFTNVVSGNVAEGFEGYRDAISRMNSRMLLLSFHFE